MRRWINALTRYAALSVVALGLMGAATCQGPAGRADALSGTLITKDSRTPVPAASVVITTPDGKSTIAKTLTDEAGRFVIVGMKDGLYKAWASKEGFFEESRTFSFPEERRLEFLLASVNRAKGTVKKPDGSVATSAIVTFRNLTSGETTSATTGEDGAFVVNDLKPGEYRVEVLSNDGTLEAKRTVTVRGGDALVEIILQDVVQTGEGVEGDLGEVQVETGGVIPKPE